MPIRVHRIDKGGSPPDGPGGGEIATPEALELAEYILIAGDLDASLIGIRAVRTSIGAIASKEALAICEAIFRDAIVQFVGCFDIPKQPCLSSEAVFGANATTAESFRFMKDLRDTYAAHRFGPQRQCFIIVREREDGSGHEVGNYRVSFSMPHDDVLPEYERMVRIAQRAIQKKIAAASSIVEQQVRDLGAEGVAKLPPVRVKVPEHHELRMSRRSFRAGGSPRRGP